MTTYPAPAPERHHQGSVLGAPLVAFLLIWGAIIGAALAWGLVLR